ncbi:TonB-dependent receptor [Alishewanella sp. 16-MA]|uniref:TonB-dependent receptor n=1 Tax=Alishewanella maricola TaxID=2795740 RepID=A0ABS8C1D5_9ALTE|nr:TonB-dependent receptor [Alishewanella maricola]MCB5226136.1 TonB-dependent receptor [Alishewanella maricola]
MLKYRLSYLAFCTLVALGTSAGIVTDVNAQTNSSIEVNQTFNFDIPAQRTSSALLELAEVAGVQIMFTPESTGSLNSPQVRGELTITQALAILLQGSGLQASAKSSSIFVISASDNNLSRIQNNFQQQLQNAEGESSSKSVERIQVVGSNIRGAKAAGNLPVTILNAEDILNTGAVTGDELLRSIPQIGDISFNNERTVGGVNDARGDVASINLRGIGTGNTLTLLNGRRLVLHPGTQTENFVPVTTVNSNTLPVAGLRRVEVLRDGAAAIYGTDAVAGVINYVLKDDVENSTINFSYGKSEGTSLDQITVNGSTGMRFNDDKSYLALSAAYYSRGAMGADERVYSANQDRRNAPGIPEEFIGRTALDNRLIASPWGTFFSSSLGTFHIQPNTMSGCDVQLANNVCADRGTQSRDLYYDPAIEDQSMTSAVDRLNLFGYFTQQLTDSTELYAEALYYRAESERRREQNANLTAQRITIGPNAAFNPFNEAVELRNYRPVDAGPRRIEVTDTSYRVLTGLRGAVGLWDWDSAVLYSRANTLDMDYNRISTSAFSAALNQTDPALAYNPFLGGAPANPNTGFSVGNSANVIAGIVRDVYRESTSELALWDFKVSNPALFSWYAGDIGIAAGAEYRYESYADDRDPTLDGSQPFVDAFTGQVGSDSDALGSSSTPDASGSRNVVSLYTELLVPLADSLSMQLALRHERFNDVGNVTKPKIALAWAPQEWLQLRAAYSGGFRAPNLPQVFEDGVVRSNTRRDPVTNASYGVEEVRGGNVTLQPEDDKTFSYGIALAPVDDLLITVDWWDIEQEGVVGILNSQTHLLYDSLLRSEGSSNTAVVRDPIDNRVVFVQNTYSNLDVREISGLDVSVSYKLSTDFGRFDFKVNAAKLNSFKQMPDPISTIVLAAQAAGNPAVPNDIIVPGTGDLVQMDGNPELRMYAAIDWRLAQWSAGFRVNYISDFFDTSATSAAGDPLPIPSWTTTDVYGEYRFKEGYLDGSRLRLGVRNLTDRDPPIADESFGYFSDVHSNRGRYIFANWSWSF